MEDVQYNAEAETIAPVREQLSQAPKFDLTERLLQLGIVADRKQAEYVLVAVVIVATIVTFFAYRGAVGGSAEKITIPPATTPHNLQ